MPFSRAFCLLLAASLSYGQDRAAVERWVSAHQRQIVSEFAALIAIPDVGTDRPNIRRNADAVAALLARHGLKSELLETAGNPLVYAEKNAAGARGTILFYIHYDGQPVD